MAKVVNRKGRRISMFRPPDFNNSDLEFRYENGEICIYGTAKGLKAISDACLKLISSPDEGHVHFDKDLSPVKLSGNSKTAALAIFS